MEIFINPKEITVANRTIRISNFPAVKGKEILAEVIRQTKGDGDLGMIMLDHSTDMKILHYASVKDDDGTFRLLDNEDIIQSFLPNTIDLIEVVMKMIDYNFGFLTDGRLISIMGLPTK